MTFNLKTMKFLFKRKITRIISSLVVTGLFLSCSDELERSPLDRFASENFWVSETNTMLALTAVYKGETAGTASAGFTDWWSYTATVLLEGATDNSYDRRGDNSPVNRLTNGTMLASNTAEVRRMWDRTYEKIARSNFFLENIELAPISDETKARMTAEARFVRAVQYYYLSQTYGAVPLITRTLTLEESFEVVKSPKREIIQFVIDELTDATNNLPRYNE